MTTEIIILFWQHHVNGKSVSRGEMNLTTTLDKLSKIKTEIALKEKIQESEIIFTYKELIK